MTDDIEERIEALWAAATAGDEYAAAAAAMAAIDDGVPMETLLLDVVAPVQARVGREWAANRISVAQEHTATAVNERVLAALAHHPSWQEHPAPGRGRITVACIDGEWHAFPARLLAEVLRVRGWQIDFLGAQVPTPHLVAHLHRTNPHAVALSSSLGIRLPAAHAAITACQAAGTPVLAGGAAFGPDGRYARLLGADAWAPDARSAAGLLAAGPVPRQPAGRAPYVACHEYTSLTRSAADLVRGVMGELGQEDRPETGGFPESGGGEEARRPYVENVAYLVDFLRAAVYVDDPELFASFTGWLANILAARDVPERVLLSALDALARRLTGMPKALSALAQAQDVLRSGGPWR
ncbi:cobalamin B12-binding domain-containing protein [Nonomuraea zeae]|uniref:cobalamin B12-binding domain-containing protein n=1 Tax=Nonomuraea zeae TaxID=1642303 RepID=UPI001F1074B5|nr:cobalamin-dependent protein [Nonomuraea zeae]